ncbi:hypothetical protein Trydic_g6598 [Trypoxylus dichotomus]
MTHRKNAILSRQSLEEIIREMSDVRHDSGYVSSDGDVYLRHHDTTEHLHNGGSSESTPQGSNSEEYGNDSDDDKARVGDNLFTSTNKQVFCY